MVSPAAVGRAAGEEGFRERRTDEPPGEQDIGWAVHHTISLCRALGLLAVGGDWADRSYELTGAGQAAALEALRPGPPVPGPSRGPDSRLDGSGDPAIGLNARLESYVAVPGRTAAGLGCLPAVTARLRSAGRSSRA
jgi:hypothetical protein